MTPPSLTLPIAILAGGLATRLRPISETVPKALVEVAGQPFLAHQLQLVKKKGATRVVLCVGHLGSQIEARIGKGSEFGLQIDYSFDGPVLRGTAGALREALPFLGRAFFVLYGDSYLDIDFQAVEKTFLSFHESKSERALMTVIENSQGLERSNVWYEQGRLIAYSKKKPLPQMNYLDYGLSIFPASTLAQSSSADLSDVQEALAAQERIEAIVMMTPYHEIGSHAGRDATESFLLTRGSPQSL